MSDEMNTAKWVVNTMVETSTEYEGSKYVSMEAEISVLRDDYQHGKKSLGWDEFDRKLIIFDQDSSGKVDELFEFDRKVAIAKKQAHKIAMALNTI